MGQLLVPDIDQRQTPGSPCPVHDLLHDRSLALGVVAPAGRLGRGGALDRLVTLSVGWIGA